MSNSSLVSYTKLSPNCTKRTAKITKITIHHMAVVNGSLEGVGNHFAQSSTKASSNYGIDSNGKVALYVDESNRAWTSSNSANDNAAVTIEVANSTGAPNWEISAAAYKSLITLCVDICKRNNIEKLNYTGNRNGNLTMHKWFANTNCPGPYLEGKFAQIAAEVNAELEKSAKPVATTTVELNILRQGATGAQVKTLQRLLSSLAFAIGTIDGSYGPKTLAGVKAFQKKRNLEQDGIVGPATWAALLK